MEQSYENFEVIIAEDDNKTETKSLLQKYTSLDIIHLFHEDLGNRKTVIQNRAILKSTGEYLIFIDGDVIPYRDFVKNQVLIAKKRVVLSGRRVNLNEQISLMLRKEKLKASTIETFYLFFALFFMFDRSVRYEQGFALSPAGFIYKRFLKKRVRNTEIIGCNFSCFKDDFVAINGFDESYIKSRIGDDIDLSWRFKEAGYQLISSKNIANVFHLYHQKISFEKTTLDDDSQEWDIFNKRKVSKIYICKDGIYKDEK
jgi:cellulose synthase/poly-beta-1,6-N-acetylglucosamine synthase-like glycosyltransferase